VPAEEPIARRYAAVVTVGSEIVEGLRLDTNTREIAFALSSRGYHVRETVSVGDDIDVLGDLFEALLASCEVVVATGGLGPTHDDITREAASRALRLPLEERAELLDRLERLARRHRTASARDNVMRQAQILRGATVLEPTSGTAPGQVARAHGTAALVLLPGPPHEMRPMLEQALALLPATGRAPARQLSCAGITESDAQLLVQPILENHHGVGLTLLATPGLVSVVLLDDGAGPDAVHAATLACAAVLGPACYSTQGETLAEVVVRTATQKGIALATAESCTGGLVAAALTSVPGSSAVYLGGVTSYADSAKRGLLGVSDDTLESAGAVSAKTAEEMAGGVRVRLGANLSVAVTGIAGPSGGTADKPVGLVWFAVSSGAGTRSERRNLFGDRDGVRARATVTALDLLRREIERA
jgi:nicotinamide-nucleotide amidase